MARNIELRPATISDAAALLEWVNNPDSLQWKRETRKTIAAGEHQAWLARRLVDPGTFMWIIESSGQAAGQVRLQRDGDAFMIDIYVAKGHRRAGLAAAAIDAAISNFRHTRGNADIVADVHKDNVASRRLFERLGFTLASENSDWLRYGLPAGKSVKAKLS